MERERDLIERGRATERPALQDLLRPIVRASGEGAGTAALPLEASTLVHDLKAPLTVIRAQAQLLRRTLEREGDAEADGRLLGRLALIDAAVTRMAAALDELLDLARAGVPSASAPVPLQADLAALARTVAEEYRQGIGAPEVEVQVEADAVTGPWDGARLRRVVENLVGNAVKYSPSGRPVTLVVSRETDGDGAWAVLRVRDRGLGIPSDALPRLFEPYFRASNVLGQVEGTGLGLAGARRLVEEHGGRLVVHSVEGLGSTFTVKLPLPAHSPEPAALLVPELGAATSHHNGLVRA